MCSDPSTLLQSNLLGCHPPVRPWCETLLSDNGYVYFAHQDIVIIEKPDPENFFDVTNDPDTIINVREPAFGKEVGHQKLARETLVTV